MSQNRNRKLDEVTVAEICDFYSRGIEIAEISEKFSLSNGYVRKVLQEAGIPLRGRNTRLSQMGNEQIEAFIADYTADMPTGELVKKYGLSDSSQIYSLLRQLGVTARTYDVTHLKDREAQIQHALALYKEGQPIWKIVESSGLDQPTLHHQLHKRGIPTRREYRRLSRSRSETV